jgi:hypothetical protein
MQNTTSMYKAIYNLFITFDRRPVEGDRHMQHTVLNYS